MKKMWLLLWAELFVLCGVLGFLPEGAGWLRLVKQAAAALFFVPPVVLLVLARRKGDDALRRLLSDPAQLAADLEALTHALQELSETLRRSAGDARKEDRR